jgi:hypothetical protein
VCLTLR